MNKVLTIIIVAAVILAGVYFFTMNKPATAPTEETSTTSVDSSTNSNSSEDMNTDESTSDMDMDDVTNVQEVMIENFAYSPATITIKVGDAITWHNMDSAPHSATADDKSFDTGLLEQDKSATITFDKAGTFTYYCSVHPNMKATVVVEE
jgi:plastocyanin